MDFDSALEKIFNDAVSQIGNIMDKFKVQLNDIDLQKITKSLVFNTCVDYYGDPTPINELAQITDLTAYSFFIYPFDKNFISKIESTILELYPGTKLQTDVDNIRINSLQLPSEKKEELVEKARKYSDNAKVLLQNEYSKGIDQLEKFKLKESSVPEDKLKTTEEKIQNLLNSSGKDVDSSLEATEQKIMA